MAHEAVQYLQAPQEPTITCALAELKKKCQPRGTNEYCTSSEAKRSPS